MFMMSILCSCSTDVDIYTGYYKDTTIVYGVIDVANDTNFIRIVRAFSGNNDASFNANEIALIEDSSNYPGKLDARLFEYKKVSGESFSPTGREIVLDTITLHNKQEGLFYAPNQKVYYTTELFHVNNAREKYKYKLLKIKYPYNGAAIRPISLNATYTFPVPLVSRTAIWSMFSSKIFA